MIFQHLAYHFQETIHTLILALKRYSFKHNYKYV